MLRKSPPRDDLLEAVRGLSTADLLRLQLVAKVFDPRRHEDLLQEAICKTLSGERKWRDGVHLFWHLYGAMESIAWDWAKKRDEDLVMDSQIREDGETLGFLSNFAASASNPERQAAARLALSRIIKACGSDSIVLALLTSKLLGKTESEIRKELKLNHQDFCAAAQRLRRSARSALGGRRYA